MILVPLFCDLKLLIGYMHVDNCVIICTNAEGTGVTMQMDDATNIL